MRDWKDTLNLPRTDFPMKANLPATEPATIARWEAIGLYGRIRERAPRRAADSSCTTARRTPTAQIHIGHALNKILKDLIVKSRSMAGFDAPYVPGWDCHGLPIELNVETELGARRQGRVAGRVPPGLPRVRREVRRLAARGLQAPRHPRRLGRPVPDDDAGLSGGHRPRARQVRRARARLQGQEAGPLVPARSHGAGRGRSRVRDPHVAVDLRRVPAVAERRRRRSASRVPALAGRDVTRADLDDDALDDSVEPGDRVPSGLRLRRLRASTGRAVDRRRGAGRDRVAAATGRPFGAQARVVQGRVARTRRGSGIRCTTAIRSACSATTSRSSRARARCTRRRATARTTSPPACGTGSTSTRRSARNGRFTADVGVVGGLKVFEANPVVEAALAERGPALVPHATSSTRIRTAGAAISR